MKILLLLFAALLVAGCGEKSSSEGSESLSDADVERLVKDAVDFDSLEEREGLYCQTNESKPFSGWAKGMYDSGQVEELAQLKDGKPHGPMMVWHENGQKEYEGTYKDGKADGLWTYRHENGQRQSETTYKDGEKVSAKYWNSKGEEVETFAESEK